MAFASFRASQMHPTALLLNAVAAGYATWRLHRNVAIERPLPLKLIVPSLPTAFLGGLVVLSGQLYFVLTGLLLIAAGVLMTFKRSADTAQTRRLRLFPASLVGGGAGLVSGLTGVGGGVFLTPLLIVFGWASPRGAATLAPPFILCNSVLGLCGVLLAGQTPAAETLLYCIGALAGAVCGTGLGHRRMSERHTRYVLAAILLFAGVRLLYR